jgi:hypothetical protein
VRLILSTNVAFGRYSVSHEVSHRVEKRRGETLQSHGQRATASYGNAPLYSSAIRSEPHVKSVQAHRNVAPKFAFRLARRLVRAVDNLDVVKTNWWVAGVRGAAVHTQALEGEPAALSSVDTEVLAHLRL